MDKFRGDLCKEEGPVLVVIENRVLVSLESLLVEGGSGDAGCKLEEDLV